MKKRTRSITCLLYILTAWIIFLVQPSREIVCGGTEIRSCIKCQGSSSQCETCIEGSFGPTCTPCGSNCQDCLDAENCLNCKPNFYQQQNSDQNTVCLPCAPECHDCIDTSTCRLCKVGYYQSTTEATCSECKSECGTCTTEDICDTCKEGFFLDFSVPSACRACQVEGCEACTDIDTCTRCQEGWFLHVGSCYNVETYNSGLGRYALSVVVTLVLFLNGLLG